MEICGSWALADPAVGPFPCWLDPKSVTLQAAASPGCCQLVCGTDVSKIGGSLVLGNYSCVIYYMLGFSVYAHALVLLCCMDLWLYGVSEDGQWCQVWKSWLWFRDGKWRTESEHLPVQNLGSGPGVCSHFPNKNAALSNWQSWPLVCHCKHISLFIARYCVCSLVHWVQKSRTACPVVLFKMQKIASSHLGRIEMNAWISASHFFIFYFKISYMYPVSESCQMPVYGQTRSCP